MFVVYTKELRPKEIFTANISQKELDEHFGGDLFIDHKDIDKSKVVVVERDIPFANPIFDGATIREMTREEQVANGIEVTLEPGEVIENGEIIKKEKPSTGLTNSWKWNGSEYIYDISEARQAYFNKIDEIKAKSLAFGFEYEIDGSLHRQRCRDKDVSYMIANIVALQTAKAMGIDKKITWYFEDNYGYMAGLQELGKLMLFGTMFVQSVYDTENFFKVHTEPKNLTEEEFEVKRKEFHKKLIKG